MTQESEIRNLTKEEIAARFKGFRQEVKDWLQTQPLEWDLFSGHDVWSGSRLAQLYYRTNPGVEANVIAIQPYGFHRFGEYAMVQGRGVSFVRFTEDINNLRNGYIGKYQDALNFNGEYSRRLAPEGYTNMTYIPKGSIIKSIDDQIRINGRLGEVDRSNGRIYINCDGEIHWSEHIGRLTGIDETNFDPFKATRELFEELKGSYLVARLDRRTQEIVQVPVKPE